MKDYELGYLSTTYQQLDKDLDEENAKGQVQKDIELNHWMSNK